MKAFWAWLRDRTDGGGALKVLLTDPIPGGARWRHTWLTLLVGAFLVQMGTGFVLWAHYSPSTQTAWESVHHLETAIPGGWFLRGLHHFGAQAFMVLLGLHVLQLILTRACRVPGELAFWSTLALVPLAVGLSVTGWMLPFDQHGYWAARVPLNLVAITPVIGDQLRVLLLGGAEVTHLTLTRFLALHAGLLPVLVAVLLALHWRWSWRQIQRRTDATPTADRYWPDQAWRDAVVLAVFVGALTAWVVWRHGAPLGAPADPTQEYAAARPEWFFLWLFQMLKYFSAGTEVWGAIVIPGLILLLLALTPWTGRTPAGHQANRVFVLGLLGAVVILSALAWRTDRRDPVYQAAVRGAEAQAARVRTLVGGPVGIPPEGALAVMRRDPVLQGPPLFARHCAACHRYDGHNGLGEELAELSSAPDLHGFASRAWLTGLLDPERIASHDYFGGTAFSNGQMVRFVQRDVARFDEDEQDQLRRIIIALSAEAQLPRQRDLDARDAALIAEGRALIDSEEMRCTECHKFHEFDHDPNAPDLTGYGSRDWLLDFIRDPAHDRFYGERNDRMPRYGPDGILDDDTLGLIVDWLRFEPDAE
jgi:ubiquinol-cytochrome c reductase cytochrome b subunit